MTTPSSGSISFSQIRNEFGATSGSSVSLGAYRVSQSVGTLKNLPLDTGVPQSGAIKASDLQGKKLNVVVDLYSIPDYSTRLTARSRYDSENVTVVGGFKSRPASSAGKRVIINVDKIIGSAKGNQNYVALRTGTWESETQLEMEIGSSAIITGAGGDGGGSNSNGTSGTSALGLEYPTTIRNRGYVQSGKGGGGGGALAQGRGNCSRTQSGCEQCSFPYAYGGGGAGGRGYPLGTGGVATGNGKSGTDASLRQDGTNGVGGNVYGGSTSNCTQYATGGTGGSAQSDGGTSSSRYKVFANKGTGGSEGFAIIYSGTGTSSSFTNRGSGSTSGPTTTATIL